MFFKHTSKLLNIIFYGKICLSFQRFGSSMVKIISRRKICFLHFTALVFRGNAQAVEKLWILGKCCMHLYQEPTPASQAMFMVSGVSLRLLSRNHIARSELVRALSSELSLTPQSFEWVGVHLQLSLKESMHLSNLGISILDP